MRRVSFGGFEIYLAQVPLSSQSNSLTTIRRLRALCYRDVLLRGLLQFLFIQCWSWEIISLISMINFGSAADKLYSLHLLN